jgi:hypothetical protein
VPALLLTAMVAVLNQWLRIADDARAAVAACPSASSHTRPQLPENDDAFVAVERYSAGLGWCHIRRGGQDKYVPIFPPTVGDVDLKKFAGGEMCPVWREGDCGAGAGGGSSAGGGGGGVAAARARVYW